MKKSRKESALRLLEELDGLQDGFIEEGMLPDEQMLSASRKGAKQRSAFGRFMINGPGAAIACGLIYLGVLGLIVRFGAPLAGDSQNPQAPGEYEETQTETLPPIEELPTLPEEPDRAPLGQSCMDEQGVVYVSYGDGTCICKGFESYTNQTAVHIPDHSPDGDVVIRVDAYAFRRCLTLTEVTLPAGLRELDHMAFPMEAPIYHIYGNILYLGSDENPYLAAVATADNNPGATSPHPRTRIIACHALTYDAGSYFALAWKNQLPDYRTEDSFTLPSGIISIGEYGLLDIGCDVHYNGYLVGWDSLTAGGHRDLIRTLDGRTVTVNCLDGSTSSRAFEIRTVNSDSSMLLENGNLFGGFFSYVRCINEDYYRWLRKLAEFDTAPDQFLLTTAPFGTDCRVLSPGEMADVRFTEDGITHPDLLEYIRTFNSDPSALFDGKTAVYLYLTDSGLYDHAVSEITVTDNTVHVILTRSGKAGIGMKVQRFALIPLDDPKGLLAGATVTYEIRDEDKTEDETESETVTEAVTDREAASDEAPEQVPEQVPEPPTEDERQEAEAFLSGDRA